MVGTGSGTGGRAHQLRNGGAGIDEADDSGAPAASLRERRGPLHGGGPCLAGQGVRWDTAGLLTSTNFKCTGAAGEVAKTAFTTDTTAVLQADFYRAGDGNDESFTAQMIVSDVDIAPDDFPGVNL